MEDITATDYDPIYSGIREAIAADDAKAGAAAVDTGPASSGPPQRALDDVESEDEMAAFERKQEELLARERAQRDALTDDQRKGLEEFEQEQGTAPIVVPNNGGARSIELAYPLMVNGKRLTKIRMRMILQEDLDAWAKGEIDHLRAFISRLTGVHQDVLAKLSWPDSDALHLIFEGIAPDYLLKIRED